MKQIDDFETGMPLIRTLIVDDEPLARDGVRELLLPHADVEIVSECADGLQALEEIEQHQPDLLFLDVQMPELDGFGVIQALKPSLLPAIIFVTAYDRYALRAFQVHALDYLLKPIEPERFAESLARARNNVQLQLLNQNLLALMQELNRQRQPVERWIVRSAGRMMIVKSGDIDWVETAGDYACLHAKGKTHLLRETMSAMAQKLDPGKFIRIHRSAIVNLDRIQEMLPQPHGEIVLLLKDGVRLTLSRTYRAQFAAAFQNTL